MISFLGREYKTNLWAASGTFGWGVEALDGGFFPQHLGSLVTKGVSPELMLGAPQPRIAEVGHGIGLLNAIGLQNPGVDQFCRKYLSRYLKNTMPCPIWVNVFASQVSGYQKVIEKILQESAGRSQWLAGFELNVSCPNVDKGGAEFGSDSKTLQELVKQCVASAQGFPIMVKLSPMASAPVDLAKACQDAGAQALAVVNTFLAGLPDLGQKDADGAQKWSLGRKFGGLSGPALKPIALRILNEIARSVDLPLCGIGGVQNYRDVLEFLSAGAQVVQIGTAHFANPWIVDEIAGKLEKKLQRG